jgi:protease-4
MSKQSTFVRIAKAIWHGLDRLRRFLHLILIVATFLVLLVAVTPQQVVVPTSAALVLAPSGVIVDQLSGDPFERALAAAQGLQVQETLLKDLVDAIRNAAGDRRIKALVLQLDGLRGAGLRKLQELAGELEALGVSGKPI